MKSYYVFICLDGVPIIEILVDSKYKVVEDYENVDWHNNKYIILNFKTNPEIDSKIIEKGNIKYRQKILTKQLKYYQVNLKLLSQSININYLKYTRSEKKILEFAKIMFFQEPEVFIDYIKRNQIFGKKDIYQFDQALKKMKKETKIITSWKNIQNKKNKTNT